MLFVVKIVQRDLLAGNKSDSIDIFTEIFIRNQDGSFPSGSAYQKAESIRDLIKIELNC